MKRLSFANWKNCVSNDVTAALSSARVTFIQCIEPGGMRSAAAPFSFIAVIECAKDVNVDAAAATAAAAAACEWVFAGSPGAASETGSASRHGFIQLMPEGQFCRTHSTAQFSSVPYIHTHTHLLQVRHSKSVLCST